jgi:hypothetical protein
VVESNLRGRVISSAGGLMLLRQLNHRIRLSAAVAGLLMETASTSLAATQTLAALACSLSSTGSHRPTTPVPCPGIDPAVPSFTRPGLPPPGS